MTIDIFSLGDFSVGAAATATGTAIAVSSDFVTISARLAYGAGGTTVIAKVQTSLNQGTTWIDVARFDFAMAGAEKIITLNRAAITSPYTVIDLAAEGSVNGILGDRLRAIITSTGTYTGSTVLALRAAASA